MVSPEKLVVIAEIVLFSTPFIASLSVLLISDTLEVFVSFDTVSRGGVGTVLFPSTELGF